MRLNVIIAALVMAVCFTSAFAQGKSEGSDKEIKDSVATEKKSCSSEKKACSSSKPGACTAAPKSASERTAAVAKEAPAKPSAVKDDPNKVIVIVNGNKITQAMVDKELEGQYKAMAESGRPMNDAMKNQLRDGQANKMAEKILIEAQMKAKKVKITDEEVEERIDGICKQYSLSRDDMEKDLAGVGMTVDDFKEKTKVGIGLEKLVEIEMKDDMKVSEEDAKKFYDENPQYFNKPEQVKATHILIKVDGDDAEKKAAARKKADDLLKQAKEGADFMELVKANSEDPGLERNDWAYTFPKGQMVPEFEKAAFALEPGGISDVVETQFGFHIIQLLEKIDEETIAYDEVKKDIIGKLEFDKKNDGMRKYLGKLRADAKMSYPARDMEKAIKPANKVSPPRGKGKLVEPPK